MTASVALCGAWLRSLMVPRDLRLAPSDCFLHPNAQETADRAKSFYWACLPDIT